MLFTLVVIYSDFLFKTHKDVSAMCDELCMAPSEKNV